MIATALSFLTGGSATRLAATLLAGALAGGYGAHQVTSWAYESKALKTQQRAARDLARAVEQQDRAVAEFTKDQQHARIEYRTITRKVDKIVERPVYRNVCLDADGMRQLSAAIAGRATPEPEPARPVPSPE